ncbi:MAG: recombinase family protein [Oscillospiraceae bacterium]|nr:recombinase family protein [Oscillospiraceae bacterium]
MTDNESREQQRQIYRREETGEKMFIPAKSKIDIYEDGRIFRTCAYCRVSTDNDAQLSSFELQQAHYAQVAGSHPNWNLTRIFADEGISGTSIKNRDEFNAMIAACEAGEYDFIVTKSVSRFARNLVDCISLIRKLKRLTPPVGVIFETDNLNTLSEDSELMLSFLATFAQEESVKKSESMIWSLKERNKSGKLLTPALLGYERPRDEAGRYIKYAPLEIVESEAEIVRFIFDAFLAGHSTANIAALLTDIECQTKMGGTEWNEGSINYILKNERYCGNVLTWKTFTADLYEHRHKKNRQDRDQYLYTNHHEAIISLEKFEATQVLLENKKHHVCGGFPVMQVIEDGIFRGFVPINHHWINDDPNTYYDASNSVETKESIRKIRRSYFSAFDFEGYQVVRGQSLTARFECPSITITNERIFFNVNCIRKFADVPYIQLLLHPTERKIAIRPCKAEDVHSIRWRTDPGRPLLGKTISCQHFGNALYQIMDWNPDYLYRVRGTWAARGSDEIIVFNLPNAAPAAYVNGEIGANANFRHRWVPLCPEEWSDTFGQEFYDYSIQNGFFFISRNYDWKAQTKATMLPDSTNVTVLSADELQVSIESLRMRAGVAHGE